MKNTTLRISSIALAGMLSQSALADDITPDINMSYGKKGFTFRTSDDNFALSLQSRFQFRYATPDDSQPLSEEKYLSEGGNFMRVNRARLKVNGHAYKPWIKYKWEYELASGFLLDFSIAVEKYDWLKFKVGQWKLEYSRERSVSSGGQQMLDRSIINRIFTIDRQQAVSVYGHLDGDGALDFNYWAGVATGTGRGNRTNDDNNMLYFGRFQWNMFGKELGFKNSDLAITDTPVAAIGIAAATNRSSFTRFSSSGGGNLLNFNTGEDGQYDINQYNVDAALMYKGLNVQSEYHEKTVTDRLDNNKEVTLTGYYVQAGYFFNQTFDWWPTPLEAAVRYATYDRDDSQEGEEHFEKAVAFNYFFNGHNNKLTADITRFEMEDMGTQIADKMRYRIQWDISF